MPEPADARPEKLSERTCIGCRKRDGPSGLLRMTVSGGGVRPDPAHRAPGRGAHLHPVTECLDLAERRKAFPRAFKVQGPLDVSAVREYVEQQDSTTQQDSSTEQDSKASAAGRPPAATVATT